MKRAYGVWCKFSHNPNTGKYQFEGVQFLSREGFETLYPENDVRPYQYDNIADMIKSVVLGLRSQNFYVKYYVQCGARFYEIWWHNVDNVPESWDRYALSESYITEKHFPRVGKAK